MDGMGEVAGLGGHIFSRVVSPCIRCRLIKYGLLFGALAGLAGYYNQDIVDVYEASPFLAYAGLASVLFVFGFALLSWLDDAYDKYSFEKDRDIGLKRGRSPRSGRGFTYRFFDWVIDAKNMICGTEVPAEYRWKHEWSRT